MRAHILVGLQFYIFKALTTLRLADDDVTENGDNHQRIGGNLSGCKVMLIYRLNLYSSP